MEMEKHENIANPMGRLFRYLRGYRGSMAYAMGSSAVHKVFDLMPPFIIGWTVDVLSDQPPGWLASLFPGEGYWQLGFCIALIFVIFSFESLTEWMLKSGFLKLAQRVQHDLRMEAYRHLQYREIAYFENNRTGNLMSMLNDDINQLERFLNDNLNQIVQLVVLFLFAGFAFGSISWELLISGLLPVPIIIWASVYYQQLIGPKYRAIRQAVGDLSSRLENNISGILVIKSFTAEAFEYKRVADASETYRNANFNAIKFSALYTPIIRMFIAVGFASGIGFAGWHILSGTGEITVGELTLFAMMIQRFLWPVTRLGVILDEYERAKASARRVFGLIDTPNPLLIAQKQWSTVKLTGKGAQQKGHLHFKDIAFGYDPENPIIKGLNLTVAPGQTLGIAGPTGGGKTTLIKLLLRLYDVQQGQISLDGTDIRKLPLERLRADIGLVSQDVYLFHGTIRENIAYGLEGATEQEIVAAARKAHLHPFVQQLQNGYDTLIGEKGIKLSGGQRQRISIARAILKNAPILILDEATSAVDTQTEREIQQNLQQLTEGKTALIVAHRLSTIRHADKIAVIEDGKVAEAGKHEELLQQKGTYAELWGVQTGSVLY